MQTPRPPKPLSEGKERCCEAERSLVWSTEQILARERERCEKNQLPDVK
jgi:hypothetical protein